jgi:PAS domain S-box-containing protein
MAHGCVGNSPWRQYPEEKNAPGERETAGMNMFEQKESDRCDNAAVVPADGCVLIDFNGSICDVNDAYCMMSGYTRNELLSLGIADIEALETTEDIQRNIQKVMRIGSYCFETRHRKKSGEIYEVDVNAAYCRPADQIIAFFRDITQRKAAERERAAHLRFLAGLDLVNRAIQRAGDLEQMMRDALDAVLLALDCDRACLAHPADPETRFWRVRMQRTAPEYPGVTPEDADIPSSPETQAVVQLLCATDGPLVFNPTSDSQMSKEFCQSQGCLSIMTMALHPRLGKPWRLDVHQCSYARVWSAEDQRLLKEIGRAISDALMSLLSYRDLRQSEERFRTLVENIPDLVVRFDREGRLLYASPKVLTMIGDVWDAVAGRKLSEIGTASKELVLQVERALPQVVRKGKSSEFIFKKLSRKVEKTFEGRLVPEMDDAGNVNSVIGIAHDVTARQRTQDEMIALNCELERRVAQRTAALERANEELESFSYSVSHDLRAPLRAIDGFSQILEEDFASALDEEGLRYLGLVRQGARKMGQLINDILAFSRMTRGEIGLEMVNMTALAREICEELQPSAGRIVHAGLDELPAAFCDRAMIRRVFVNLIGNAIKYSSAKPETKITISAEVTDDDIIYCVKDNGAGFDMAYSDKLFGVFQRLHSSEEFEGTGIGLAIVKRIVERHGGRVWAEGRVGEGAAFYFSLPRYVETARAKGV